MNKNTVLDVITLGELIRQLKAHPPQNIVKFDFGHFVPTTLDSYRGFYEQLAIGYKEIEKTNDNVTVSDFLQMLKLAVGESYYGWKGGCYTMKETTPVWVSNAGYADQTGVVGVIDSYGETIIETRHIIL